VFGGNKALSAEIEAVAARVRASVVLIESGRGHGSGVVWNERGLVVTNHHVASKGSVRVELPSGPVVGATVLKSDPVVDLALLQIEPRDVATAPLHPAAIGDSTRLRVGDLVIAVGNPLGVRGSAALGIVSGTQNGTWMGRARTDIVQADIKLAPGNSGGPIVNVDGEVVGIASMVLSPGVAIAVPTHIVQRMARSLDAQSPQGSGRFEQREGARAA
jgi:serine protease Do